MKWAVLFKAITSLLFAFYFSLSFSADHCTIEYADLSAREKTLALKAQKKGLHYALDLDPSTGIQRKGREGAFYYVDARHSKISSEKILERIESLRIPPAYKEVVISPDSRAHLQAKALSEEGKWQYFYHPLWAQVREEVKFDRLYDLIGKMPTIRKTIAADMKKATSSFEAVAASAIRTIEKTGIRAGNEGSALDNASYGITTLQKKHVDVRGEQVRLQFLGKSGVEQLLEFEDSQVAKIFKALKKLKGKELFQYENETKALQDITDDNLNAYFKSVAGKQFSLKDLRTMRATKLVIGLFHKYMKHEASAELIEKVLELGAKELGNTPAVLKSSYVDPRVIQLFEKGKFEAAWKEAMSLKARSSRYEGLDTEEVLLLEL